MKSSDWLSPFISEVLKFDVEVLGLSKDSRKVEPGSAFLAYKGYATDGRRYLQEAVLKGASLLLYDPSDWPSDVTLPDTIPSLAIEKLREKEPYLSAKFYGEPSSELSISGVTGTNGKTTIAFQLAQASEYLAQPSAYIGTLGQGRVGMLSPLLNTTPDAVTLQAFFADCLRTGIGHVFMEVSSHALSEGRVLGTCFRQAIFTNLTQDHLDYHGTMEAYADAKARLFAFPSLQHAIFNEDDPASKKMQTQLSKETVSMTYGMGKGATIRALSWDMKFGDTRLFFDSPWGNHTLNLNSLGLFSLYNAMAVFTALMLEGHDVEAVKSVMMDLTGANGRLEMIAKEPCVVVDYAHTPDALENVLKTLKEIKKGKLWVVFGCGGARDKGKRPLMGDVAVRYADEVIVTSDNPRTEEPETIIQDILMGISNKRSVTVEVDRKKAIDLAILNAEREDIVLIAGKGHETYQEIHGIRTPFSDKEIGMEAVKKRNF